MTTLDNAFVRSQFPAFSEPTLAGQAFFENAGGSYTCQQVIERLTRFYTARKIQPFYPHRVSQLGGEEMDEARTRLAAYMGVASDELNFGPSTTQNTYVLARAFGEWLKPGDVIVVTNQDHEANIGPWRRLSALGIEIREWQVDPATGSLDLNDLSSLLDERVKLVCFPHCSNLVAEINPVKDIVNLIHSAGAYTCVDAVSYAPHGFPNVADLGADIYLFSSYKTYGPHQGIMVVRRELAKALPNQGHYFNEDVLNLRFVPAGPDHAQVAASAGMVDYFESIYQHHSSGEASGTALGASVNKLIAGYEQALLQPLLDYVDGKQGVRLLGPSDATRRAATVSFMTEKSAEVIANELADLNIIAAWGSYYAPRLMQAMNLDTQPGAVRVSFTHYTSQDEITQLIDALERVL
ncbi:MAG: aminotransferase class V-fold PLP-dependent enzyme [Halioglobus sp.]